MSACSRSPRRWPAGLALWAYYWIVLGPVSGIVHAGYQLAHDRYSYLSCLGWALLVGAAVGSAVRSAARRGVAALAQGARSLPWRRSGSSPSARSPWYQLQIWRDTETLWRYAVEADPAVLVCQSNLGVGHATAQDFLRSARRTTSSL